MKKLLTSLLNIMQASADDITDLLIVAIPTLLLLIWLGGGINVSHLY